MGVFLAENIDASISAVHKKNIWVKKIFPIIILLITLSLVGIIFIQVSWFNSMLENIEEELKIHVATLIDEVGEQLIAETTNALPNLKN